MIIVVFTSWMESRMKVESSRTTCSETPGGSSPASFSTAAPHAVRHRHRVGARLLLHVEGQGGLLVEEGQRSSAPRPRPPPGPGRARRWWSPPARLTGMRGDVGGAAAARGHAHQRLGGAAVGGAGRRVHVLAAQRVHHVGQRDVVGLEPRAVHHHLDLARGLADQVHRAHAGHVLQPPLDDLVREVGGGLRARGRAR